MHNKLLKIINFISLIFFYTIFISFITNVVHISLNFTSSTSFSYTDIIIIETLKHIGYLLILLFVYILLNRIVFRKSIKELGIASSKQKVLLFVLTFIVLVSTISVSIVKHQDKLIFHPFQSPISEQRLDGLDNVSRVSINSTYSGWLKTSDTNTSNQLLLIFGGNVQNAASYMDYLESNDWFELSNIDIVMIDYPGYGNSSGTPSEESLFEMGTAVYTYFETSYDEIIVLGYSLGTGVASYVASQKECSKLILLAPYTSMVDIANSKLPIFYGPIKALLQNQFDVREYQRQIDEETLIIASEDDNLIFSSISREVEIRNAMFVLYHHLSHNDIISSEDVLAEVKEFIDE